MLTIEYAKNPVYGNAEETCILLTVKLQELNKEMPFAATSYDPHQHGRDLYTRAKAGEFGEIDVFIDPMVATQPQPTTTGLQDL